VAAHLLLSSMVLSCRTKASSDEAATGWQWEPPPFRVWRHGGEGAKSKRKYAQPASFRLQPMGGSEAQASFSPDGSHIAFDSVSC
jgi:hypothetical protein